MCASESDRYSLEDPTSVLKNFFTGRSKHDSKKPNFYTGLTSEGDTGVQSGSLGTAPEPEHDPDTCVDWDRSPKEVAAWIMALKGGNKEESEAMVRAVLAEVQSMVGAWTTDEPASYFQGNKNSGGGASYYTGL